MVTTELGACEWFIWDLRRSNLIDRGQLDQIVGEFMQSNPRAEPPALAAFLVEKGILSEFQSDRLLQGKTQGFVLGPFTLMDALGAGSMGTVYKAQSKNDQKSYAVKVLPRRSMWNVRIARRKVRAFEACRHPSVVPFVDVGTAGSMHYLAWPFVQGEGLDKVVQKQGKLKPGVAANYALQVAEALEVCHQQALFHGLLKPSNLMLGNEGQIYILDFGIGCLLAETEGESLVDTMSTANSVASGLDCASPESIMDPTNLTPAGDQYSLGCVLYYCLTGKYPFADGTSAEKMMAHQFKEPPPIRDLNPDAPVELVEVVQRLMQKIPENRYPGAGGVVEALRPLADLSSTPAGNLTPPPPPPPRPANNGRSPSAEARPAPTAPEPRAKPTSPSAQTPKPQANVLLPTRQTVHAAAAPAPHVKPPVEKQRQQTHGPDDKATDAESWDDKVGQVGIILIAVTACAVAWALMTFLL
jgi:serine/threonine protein kinase